MIPARFVAFAGPVFAPTHVRDAYIRRVNKSMIAGRGKGARSGLGAGLRKIETDVFTGAPEGLSDLAIFD
jgi:hypothetical protein